MTRLLVTGGRRYSDAATLFAALDAIRAERGVSLLIHGGASGADTLAGHWAESRGVPVQVFLADWSRGPKAGPERNARMLAEGRPELVVAFPGSRGTADCVRKARDAGVEVRGIGDG